MNEQATTRFQFRLVHVFYTMTLFGSCLALFGGCGIAPFAVIVVFWGYVFSSRSRPQALLNACLALFFGSCLIGLLLPAFSSAREAARRSQCSNNLKQIVLALHNYQDAYGEFPPACVRDKDGKPMHSWRVLILPFIEQKTLYDQYRFDEPWDGPNNRKLMDKINPWTCPYRCPSDRRDAAARWTSYVAVVGPRTAWGEGRGRRLNDFPDGTSNTVLIVEYQGGQIAWTEPRDLALAEALDVLTSTLPDKGGIHRREDFFFEYGYGRNVAIADGSVRYVLGHLPKDVWSSLLTIDDGGGRSDADLPGPTSVGTRRVRIGNWLRLATFVLLTVLPLPWVWRRPDAEISPEAIGLDAMPANQTENHASQTKQ